MKEVVQGLPYSVGSEIPMAGQGFLLYNTRTGAPVQGQDGFPVDN